ncbi:MAG: hypothetical protein JWQ14_3501, partial [Adhaeribacter sp.]|nr:hypothetical protein [Adhaeribacter sp.]
GNARNLVTTETVLTRIHTDHDILVDEKAFARARLFDMLIGDWERQEGQWRWKEQLRGNDRYFIPVPEDRDVAFFKADGLVPYLASRSWASRSYQNFGYDFGDIRGLNQTAEIIDHTFLSRVPLPEWEQIATEMQASLTDAAIDDAIKQLPPEIQALSGKEIGDKLKARRALLPKAVKIYYGNIAEIIDITGSDKRELFQVNRLPAGQTQITVFKVNEAGTIGKVFYERLFPFPETEEIRLYGLGGNDIFKVTGESSKGAKIRIVGGEGRDSIMDNSTIHGLTKRSWIYDTEKENYFNLGSEAHDRMEPFKEVNRYERGYYETSQFIPRLFLEYNPDDALLLNGEIRMRVFEFRKKPEAGNNTLLATYLPRHHAVRLKLTSDISEFIYKYNLRLNVLYHSPQETFNYFGLGNKTAWGAAKNVDYYRVKYSRFTVNPSLQTNLFSFVDIGGGPLYDQFTVYANEDKFLNTSAAGDAPLTGSVTNKYLGGRVFADLIATSSPVNPRIGLKWMNSYSLNWELAGAGRRFSQFISEANFFLTPNFTFQPTWALRIGGAKNFGNFQFYQANALGGTENLRGYRRFRYAGRSIFYTNLEARIPVTTLNLYLSPARLGVMAHSDFGKVTQPKSSRFYKGFHRGIGGGLWADFNRQSGITATYTFGEEALFNLECKFRF